MRIWINVDPQYPCLLYEVTEQSGLSDEAVQRRGLVSLHIRDDMAVGAGHRPKFCSPLLELLTFMYLYE